MIGQTLYYLIAYYNHGKLSVFQPTKIHLASEGRTYHSDMVEYQWIAKLMYEMLYSMCIMVIVCQVIYGIYATTQLNPNRATFCFILAALDLIPFIVVYSVGHDKCFTLLVRYFEYDVHRLQEDGAFLAALIMNSRVFDTKNNVYWFYRSGSEGQSYIKNKLLMIECSNDSKRSPCETTDLINRAFWIKGQIQDPHNLRDNDCNSFTVSFDYADDMNLDWTARYNNLDLTFDYKTDNVSSIEFGFQNWVQQNFDLSKACIVDTESLRVIISVEIHKSNLTGNDLLVIAKSNLRSFRWEKFTDDLLLSSPRELSSNEEKLRIYNLSEHITVTRRIDKIDYFVSHSWEDSGENKCEVLRKFSEDFNSRHGRYPTFWLDKVCIDQMNPTNGIATLPINIGSCQSMLVLMSSSYMKRLWCVWELLTLFTFCNKELALERIKILSVKSKDNVEVDILEELENFDINNAHCFDPNEELKLRKIISMIGIERLKRCVNDLAETKCRRNRGKGRHSPSIKHKMKQGVS